MSARAVTEANGIIADLRAKLAQAERERDAAVETINAVLDGKGAPKLQKFQRDFPHLFTAATGKEGSELQEYKGDE